MFARFAPAPLQNPWAAVSPGFSPPQHYVTLSEEERRNYAAAVANGEIDTTSLSGGGRRIKSRRMLDRSPFSFLQPLTVFRCAFSDCRRINDIQCHGPG